MQVKHCIFFLLLFALSTVHAQPKPPAVKKEPKVFKEHGGERIDNYYWLSNSSDSNVIHYLKAENAYVEAYMKPTEALQKKIYNELVARIPQKDQSLPNKRNGYWYYSRFDEGKQYPYVLRKKAALGSKEEMLLNIPELAKKYKIYLLRGSAVSFNNQHMVYGVDTAGDRRSILYLKNLLNGQLAQETISNTSGSYAWVNNNKAFYYVLNDHTVRAYKVMQHVVGTNPSADREIYTEKDSTYGVYLNKSSNGRYIFIISNSTNTSEARYLDANNPNAQPVLIQARTPDLEYNP